MRFVKINHYVNPDNTSAKFANQRIEYFHHYWSFLFQKKSRNILITDEKFESHPSLFHKIDIQLKNNSNHYAQQLNNLLVDHSYFSSTNIIIRKSPSSKNKIQNFITFFNT